MIGWAKTITAAPNIQLSDRSPEEFTQDECEANLKTIARSAVGALMVALMLGGLQRHRRPT